MLTLYKCSNDQLLYWETWDSDFNAAVVHWGIVGEEGKQKEVKSTLFTNYKKVIRKQIDEKLKEGFIEFSEFNISYLEIVYKIEGLGTEYDLDKKHALEKKLGLILKTTGLGQISLGNMGAGIMTVNCIVIDFEIAKDVIVQALNNTDFEDYSAITRVELE